MSKKKICLVIPSLQAGGMERVMSELAVYFAAKSEVEIHIILYGITREIFFQLPDNIIIHLPKFRFDNKLRFLNTLKTSCFLRNTVKKINPISILSFGEYWNSFVIISLFGLKYSIFISDRCQPDKSLGAFHNWLRKKLYPRVAGIIAQTEKAKEIYLSNFSHNNIKVIGNPIRSINDQENIIKENIVLMVGRLIKTKHQDELIRLFIRISKPGWKLIIVGYDHLKQNNFERLERIIDEDNFSDSVILAGKQSDIEKFYLSSKIFAFTSSSEGFPNVIGEAMSSGLPVIAFDCVAGPSEMIKDNKNGFLIPLFDYKLFQEKLKILMENEDLRISFGKKGREDIKQFSINIIGEQYFQLLLSQIRGIK
jgi:GalNAc-alpha-(1->4)-GalNAc-alpha-(1->3)-diNAcBac-PP-undecaprenol alpha-1,4-N-acetyl-D-galactosaminyltransferase